jgi:uncharacterized oxidoreductase
MRLSGNTILITGGTSGIGLELASRLEAMGNQVIATGRDPTKLKEAKTRTPRVHFLSSDVAQPAEIRSLFRQITNDFPDTNVVINNAGILREINMHDPSTGLDTLTDEIEINLNGPIRMVQQFLPHLKSKANAAIINVTSGLAFVPLPTSPIYSATKAALHSYTRSLRVQLKNTQVKVFELAPPVTRTPMMSDGNPKGARIMSVEDLVGLALEGFERDQFEIRPGQANLLKLLSRIAPEFILKRLSGPVDRMLADARAW